MKRLPDWRVTRPYEIAPLAAILMNIAYVFSSDLACRINAASCDAAVNVTARLFPTIAVVPSINFVWSHFAELGRNGPLLMSDLTVIAVTTLTCGIISVVTFPALAKDVRRRVSEPINTPRRDPEGKRIRLQHVGYYEWSLLAYTLLFVAPIFLVIYKYTLLNYDLTINFSNFALFCIIEPLLLPSACHLVALLIIRHGI